MVFRYICILCFCVCLYAEIDFKELQPLETKPSYQTTESTQNTYTTPLPYKPSNSSKYLLTSSGIILGGTFVGAGVLYLMPESVTNWDKNDIVNLGKNWRRRTAMGPVVDSDDWFLNWVTHPYWGAVYYMQPRTAGYSWSESAFYSVIASSLFWEYGVEAFAEVPSWQDLIITPAIGSIFGELFYRARTHIQAKGDTLLGSRVVGKVAMTFLDPIGTIMQDFGLAKSLGIYNKKQTQSFIMPTNSRNGVGMQLVVAMQW